VRRNMPRSNTPHSRARLLWAGLLLCSVGQAHAQNWVTAELRTLEFTFTQWTFKVTFNRPVRQFAPFNT
jgi:hypothetical protein